MMSTVTSDALTTSLLESWMWMQTVGSIAVYIDLVVRGRCATAHVRVAIARVEQWQLIMQS